MDFAPIINQITPILADLLIAVVGLVVAFVGNETRKLLSNKSVASNISVLQTIATIGVQAAEQLYASEAGDDKKAYAIQYVQNELDRHGLKFDVDAIETAIEAAVLAEFNYPSALEPAPTETVVTASASKPAADK